MVYSLFFNLADLNWRRTFYLYYISVVESPYQYEMSVLLNPCSGHSQVLLQKSTIKLYSGDLKSGESKFQMVESRSGPKWSVFSMPFEILTKMSSFQMVSFKW